MASPIRLMGALLLSRRLALWLILAIAAASLAGALLPQAPGELLSRREAVDVWVERLRPRYGVSTDLLASLQLFWVFDTFWFRGLLALLATSIVVCTTGRLPAVARAVFATPPLPGDVLFERGAPRATVLFGTGAEDALHRALRGSRYRAVQRSLGGASYVAADRDRFARFGTFLTHGALVLVLAASVASGPLGYFAESGFAVPVGSVRDIGHGTTLSVYVDDFADEYYAGGRPKDYRTDAIVYDAGREVARQTIRVNEPLVYGGVSLHQASFGTAAALTVSTARDGRQLFRDAIALAWKTEDGARPVGYAHLPERDLDIYLVGPADENDPLLRPGQVVLEAYRGDGRTPTYHATLTQRQPQTADDLTFLFERELPFSGLRIVRDPSAPVVWLASALLLLGLVLTTCFPHRRVWARVRDGTLTLVGAGRENTDEVERLARDLREARDRGA